MVRDSTGRSFDSAYRLWGFAHAGVAVAAVAGGELLATPAPVFGFLAVWTVFAMAFLFLLAARRHPDGTGPRLANALTSVRAAAAALLLAGLALGAVWPPARILAQGRTGWWLVAVLLLVEVTDFLDGRVARRLNAGRFGSIWDMENDAVFALALSIANRHLHAAGTYVLLIGLMRYLYVLLWHRERVPVRAPRIQTLFSKTTTAVLVTTLIVVLAPAVSPALRAACIAVILGMQITSFAWDIVLQVRERPAAR